MVYTKDSKSFVARRGGSSPPLGTKNNSYGKVGAYRSPNYRRIGIISCNVRDAVEKWTETQDSPLRRTGGVTGFNSRDKRLFFHNFIFHFSWDFLFGNPKFFVIFAVENFIVMEQKQKKYIVVSDKFYGKPSSICPLSGQVGTNSKLFAYMLYRYLAHWSIATGQGDTIAVSLYKLNKYGDYDAIKR